MNTHVHQFNDAAVNAMLEKVRNLQPLIRQHAAQGESERRVPQAVIDALAEAGAFRTSIPRRYGGLESSMRTMLDVSSVIGEADGGTAWVVTLINVCNWAAGLFPIRAQEDIFGSNPNARVTGVLTPTATSVKLDGGYRISGKWFYNSGSWHADWAMLGIPIVDEAGEPVDQATAMIPSNDLRLEETWFVAGMSSTGSNCILAEDVFVPQHRILSMSAALKDDSRRHRHAVDRGGGSGRIDSGPACARPERRAPDPGPGSVHAVLAPHQAIDRCGHQHHDRRRIGHDAGTAARREAGNVLAQHGLDEFRHLPAR
jgi:alkylation response protein AidB-like acyl-CoA dehydrogenase